MSHVSRSKMFICWWNNLTHIICWNCSLRSVWINFGNICSPKIGHPMSLYSFRQFRVNHRNLWSKYKLGNHCVWDEGHRKQVQNHLHYFKLNFIDAHLNWVLWRRKRLLCQLCHNQLYQNWRNFTTLVKC